MLCSIFHPPKQCPLQQLTNASEKKEYYQRKQGEDTPLQEWMFELQVRAVYQAKYYNG
jgi:hypothetical protein